jgi:hypothetical protein
MKPTPDQLRLLEYAGRDDLRLVATRWSERDVRFSLVERSADPARPATVVMAVAPALVASLERAGWIAMEPVGVGRRRWEYRLTDAGAELARASSGPAGRSDRAVTLDDLERTAISIAFRFAPANDIVTGILTNAFPRQRLEAVNVPSTNVYQFAVDTQSVATALDLLADMVGCIWQLDATGRVIFSEM